MTAERDNRTALAVRPPGTPPVVDDVQLQQLWVAIQRRPWNSLAILAAGKGVSTIEFANVLAKVAWFYRGQPTCVFDLRDLSLRLVEHELQEIAIQVEQGELVFVALRSLDENPTARPIARAADAAILCVKLGETRMTAAERAIAEIGRERFLGSVVLAPPKRRR